MDLLGENSSDDEKGQTLKINKKFAERFESQQRTQELQKSKAILEDEDSEDSDSESESEDDEAEQLSAAVNLQILNTINSLRKKDPRIYDKTTTWFEENAESTTLDGEDEDLHVRKTYKDVLREQLLSHGADVDKDSEFDSRAANRLAYDREQEDLRQQFLRTADTLSDSDSDNGNLKDASDLLQVKKKTKTEMEQDEIALQEALSEMKKLAKDDNELNCDQFLSEYISKRKWVVENDDNSDDDDLENDENELDKVDHFESKYNFRFEELQEGGSLGGVEVVGHARSVAGSLRRVDDKRKQQRAERQERKEREKRQKEAELKRLKNLKKQEVSSLSIAIAIAIASHKQ